MTQIIERRGNTISRRNFRGIHEDIVADTDTPTDGSVFPQPGIGGIVGKWVGRGGRKPEEEKMLQEQAIEGRVRYDFKSVWYLIKGCIISKGHVIRRQRRVILKGCIIKRGCYIERGYDVNVKRVSYIERECST